MTSRIIVKNLPKKISEDRFRIHFSKIGQVTDAKLKFTTEGKFRNFGFIGYKTEEDALKAIEYFNNTFIDASKLIVESCRPLNNTDRLRPWSKYSKESSAFEKKNKAEKKPTELKEKKSKKETKSEKKEKKLEKLIGPLKDDEEFKEFLEANKAIKANDRIWKNDISLNTSSVPDQIENENSNPQDEEENQLEVKKKPNKSSKPKKSKENEIDETEQPLQNDCKDLEKKATILDENEDADFENGRLYVRNLCYQCKEEDLEKLFQPYGPLVETSMPIDNFSKNPKGFAYITCMFPEKALKAFNELDGSIFQGRMLHILPAKTKQEKEENGEEISFKKKKEIELKKKSQSNHNWNSLFLNQDAIANLMASRYNVDKSQLYDVHSANKKNGSVAVKMAVGETQIVNDMRKFLIRNGVKLDSFSSNDTERSKTIILIKNLPNGTSETDLKELFKKFSVSDNLKRLVMPDYGLAALVEFGERQEARDAFKKLAYKKFKNVPIYLEWAPVDVFEGDKEEQEKLEKEEAEILNKEKETQQKLTNKDEENAKITKTNKINESDDENDYEENSTIFVKNLNFDTNEESLQKAFSKIGKCKASIARKISLNKEPLSMGYGFVKFKKAAHAIEAIKSLQNHSLDGHNLELKFSNRPSNNYANESAKSRKQVLNKQNKTKSSKILVRNIPFEAKTKEIEELFQVFGQLKYVRLPKKIDGAHRGFGFVDFITVNDAERAFESLSHSTHLFGRRLVLEWAEPEQTQDVEILRLKEEKLNAPISKKLKKSKILEDLGREDFYEGKVDVGE